MRVGAYDSFVGLSSLLCQFTVTADVVPLELTLSQKELTMQFAEDSVESTVSETIIMENPGTHHLKYLGFQSRAPSLCPGND